MHNRQCELVQSDGCLQQFAYTEIIIIIIISILEALCRVYI